MSSARFLVAAAVLIAALPSTSAFADDVAGYLVSSDRQPVHDSIGECWHTGEWQDGMRFANCEPRPVRAVAAAAPASKAAPTPAPAPKRVLEAPKPLPTPPVPLRFSADTLFQFDSATLTPQGRAALDALEKQITGAQYTSVDVSGHADRLGAPSYNLRLSERRADAVGDYLAEHGIDAQHIHTTGLGSAQPVTSSEQCKGLPRARLIECLQPDRYAEITVVGTARAASAQ